MVVFLALGGLAFGFLFFPKTGTIEEKGVFGGPALIPSAQGAETDTAAVLKVQDAPFLASTNAGGQDTDSLQSIQTSYDTGAIKDPGEAIVPSFDRLGENSYVIQKGDSLSRIASYFGVSVETIVSANPSVRGGVLKKGSTLNILPTSGVVYQAKAGDTLQSIANTFSIPEDKIVQFNQSVNFASLSAGDSIIIPGGKNANFLAGQNSGLPNFNSEFIMPTNGYNWGTLHHYNAVDIANSCGTPVVAAAEGLVIPDEETPDTIDGWNGGYGNFVLIEHPFSNGVRTRYAHLAKVLVQIGDYVKQGQEIGLMGETGDATGCHLHFEVYGAQNPFAK